MFHKRPSTFLVVLLVLFAGALFLAISKKEGSKQVPSRSSRIDAASVDAVMGNRELKGRQDLAKGGEVSTAPVEDEAALEFDADAARIAANFVLDEVPSNDDLVVPDLPLEVQEILDASVQEGGQSSMFDQASYNFNTAADQEENSSPYMMLVNDNVDAEAQQDPPVGQIEVGPDEVSAY